MGKDQKLRGVVVGVGYLGNFHAQKIKALSANHPVELYGVCDVNQDQLKKISTELGVRAVAKPEDLIGQVDFAVIATQTPYHFQVAELFLKNGIHVNVEKPICLNVEQAKILVHLAEKNNLKLAVGHSERFNLAFVELKKHIKEPSLLKLNRQAPFNVRGSDVSVVFDLMVHDLDLMFNIDSSEAMLLNASGGREKTDTHDWAKADFEFASGLKCSISVGRLALEMTRAITLFDGAHVYTANLQNGDFEVAHENEAGQINVQKTNVGRGDNLMKEDEDFVSAIIKNRAPQITGNDGLRAVYWAEKVIEKINQNGK